MLRIVPCSLREANAFIARHHRHHKQARGCKFTLALENTAGEIVGVAVVGRPNAKAHQDGRTAELTRLCTDGTRNACSKLYAAARRIAGIMGYQRLLTYTAPEEGGASLRGVGLKEPTAQTEGRSWSRPKRGREDKHLIGVKDRWEESL